VKALRESLKTAGILLLVATLLLAAGCKRGRGKVLEVNYVSAPQVNLRDRLATVYNKVATVKNGERLEVLEHQKRFVRVRTAGGVEGWIEQRYLVDQPTFDGFQKLAQENRDAPVQAHGTTRNDTNLHLTPGRETEHLYQIPSGEKLLIIKRGTAEKSPASAAPPVRSTNSKKEEPKKVLEDWWLVRDTQQHVGWVLSRMVDIDVPLDVAQYAEGQRFIALFQLNEVQDGDKKVPQYLAVLSEPHDGLPYDFDQVRVFTWNTRRHRYETAYREHGLEGMLPVIVGQEDFEKEGKLPTFTLRVNDVKGQVTERKYKLNTPIVRRVLSPGEQKQAPASVHHNKKRR
jgi:SH3-like domain-containing protein